jgi:hypothetical protein
LNQETGALQNDHVTAGNIQQAYRPALGGMLVDSYFESLAHGQVRCLYFTIKMVEARRNRLVRKLGNSIAKHRNAIIEAINTAVQSAIGVFSSYTGLPVQKVAEGLLGKRKQAYPRADYVGTRAIDGRYFTALLGNNSHGRSWRQC